MNNLKNSLKTIFVIDDDMFQHKIINHLLKDDKYNLVFISSGTEALTMLIKERPDLVLLDINMPGIDGLEVLQRIKQYRHLSGMPIIMISGMCEKKIVMQSMLHGAVDFVAKPFNRDLLLQKIRSVLTDAEPIQKKVITAPIPKSSTYSTLPLIPIIPELLRNLSIFFDMIEKGDASIESHHPEIVRLIELDTETSSVILKIINSPLYGANQVAQTISEVLESIGFINMYELITSISLRNAITSDKQQAELDLFWEKSARTGLVLAYLATRIANVDKNIAFHFGIFHDSGRALMMRHFPTHIETLRLSSITFDKNVTTIEDSRHYCNHAQCGAILAIAWGMSDTIVTAIRYHHHMDIIKEHHASDLILSLIAMGNLAEYIESNNSYLSDNQWTKYKEEYLLSLKINDQQATDLITETKQMLVNEFNNNYCIF